MFTYLLASKFNYFFSYDRYILSTRQGYRRQVSKARLTIIAPISINELPGLPLVNTERPGARGRTLTPLVPYVELPPGA